MCDWNFFILMRLILDPVYLILRNYCFCSCFIRARFMFLQVDFYIPFIGLPESYLVVIMVFIC